MGLGFDEGGRCPGGQGQGEKKQNVRWVGGIDKPPKVGKEEGSSRWGGIGDTRGGEIKTKDSDKRGNVFRSSIIKGVERPPLKGQ